MLAVGMQSVRGALVGEPRIMTYPQRCPTHVKKLRSGWELALLSFHSQSDAELTTAISRRGVAGAMLVERATKKKPSGWQTFYTTGAHSAIGWDDPETIHPLTWVRSSGGRSTQAAIK